VAAHVPIVGLSILPVLIGLPMLLMPVHILFLQLIIDPACSVVFEAEALEADAMKVAPRRTDQRLFDRALMVRGVWQGGGLLVLLLGTYASAHLVVPADAGRDDMARALTFVVLVLSNLALIQANRSWVHSTWHSSSASNRQFGWIAVGTIAMLCGVLFVPAISRLFSFVTPTPVLLAAALGVSILSLIWFECVKWGLRARSTNALKSRCLD